MQELLDSLRVVVAAFEPKRKDTQIERVEQLVQALTECREYIENNEKNDRGCAQRLSREVDEILSALPQFKHLGNKQDMASRHTRKLAEDHLLEIQKQLQELIEADKRAKQKELRDWVNKHPVFGKLRRACMKKGLPKDTFVLLFERNAEGELELLPRSVEENSVLTRFRPIAFVDDIRVHNAFAEKKTIAGAALISDNKLVEVMGEVPAPTENRDQLAILLFHSNEVASGPAREYVDGNEVLKTLHELSRKKDIPKDAYVLLFRAGDEEFFKLVDKTTAEGKVITRFWGNDFARKHHLFEMFRGEPPVIGGAVIKERDVVHAVGILPAPNKHQSQLDAILQHSNKAVQRPSVDFVEANEVLNGLSKLANSKEAPREAYVLLFSRSATSPYALVTGRFGPRMLLEDFKSPRAIHQTFGERGEITGASVIVEGSGKPFVANAFGKTPLKQSMLAVPENFQRLGLPAEAAMPPRQPHNKDRGGKHRPNKQRTSK